MRILVTGGQGFIGSNFIRFLLQANPPATHPDRLVNIDKLTYAGNVDNLAAIEADPRYRFARADICDAEQVSEIVREERIDTIVHMAAESHVDRSIADASQFLRTNVLGTQVLLDVARRLRVKRFVHVSTDEVYGSLGESGYFTEDTPLLPNNPYSASKASSDLLVRAAYKTFGLPVVITRCSNNYGPFQFPEKLIPLMIANALEDRPLPVYGDGRHVRDWIYVEDHCRGILRAMEAGRPGQVYNFGGHCEKTNIEVVQTILDALGKPRDLIAYVADRPGHDRRYAMSTEKAERELSWRPLWTFERGIEATIKWYVDNKNWLDRIRSGACR